MLLHPLTCPYSACSVTAVLLWGRASMISTAWRLISVTFVCCALLLYTQGRLLHCAGAECLR